MGRKAAQRRRNRMKFAWTTLQKRRPHGISYGKRSSGPDSSDEEGIEPSEEARSTQSDKSSRNSQTNDITTERQNGNSARLCADGKGFRRPQ